MTKRLDILNNSLIKKQKELDSRITNHMATVKESNGQPLNDKRNGAKTLAKWEKQEESIQKQMAEVEKTKQAIEKEQDKIASVKSMYDLMPIYLTDLIDQGHLRQWRKHPRILFVEGVDNARLVFDPKTGSIKYKNLEGIPTKEQFTIFRDTFNGINAKQRKGNK